MHSPVRAEWWFCFLLLFLLLFFVCKAFYMLNWKLETKLGVWGFWFVCLGLGFQVLCRDCGGGGWLSMFVSFWFWARVSLCSPNWPRTLYVAQSSFQLTGPLPRPAGNTGAYHRTKLGYWIFERFCRIYQWDNLSRTLPCGSFTFVGTIFLFVLLYSCFSFLLSPF